MKQEKRDFSNLEPEVREMLLMKYYSNKFIEIYNSNENWKRKKKRFIERQERLFQAYREGKRTFLR